MDTRNEEQVIYLKDLVFAALYQWRKVLVIALILALLLGGLQAYRMWSAPQADITDAALEQYETQKQFLTNNINSLKSDIQSQTSFLENSLLMSLNPYSYWEARGTVYVDTGYQILPDLSYQNTDKTNAVLGAYATILTGEAVIKEIAEGIDIDSSSLSDLICIETGSGTITVRVKYTDKTGAESIVRQLVAQIENNRPAIASTVADHRTTVLEQSVRQQKSTELADLQKREAAHLVQLTEDLKTAEAELDALIAPEASTVSTGEILKKAVTFAVIGGILGIFLAVCGVWVAHITGSRIYSARVLVSKTGIKVLGCLGVSIQKCGIDRFLRKAEGRSITVSTSQADLLAVNVANLCGDIKHLLVTGSAGEDRNILTEALTRAMPGVRITDNGSLLCSKDSMRALKDADAVLIVEQCGVSRYSDAALAAATVRDHKKELIGCIVLDG